MEEVYVAGYGSSSRLYEEGGRAVWNDACHIRERRERHDYGYAIVGCHLGWWLGAATSRRICSEMLGDTEEQLTAELFMNFRGRRSDGRTITCGHRWRGCSIISLGMSHMRHCLLMFRELPFRCASGKNLVPFHAAGPSPAVNWRAGSTNRRHPAPWGELARPIQWRL